MTSKLLGYNDISDSELLALGSKYLYIPLVVGNNQDITILVKKNDYVFKGEKIGKSKGNFSTFIYSPVSGIVIGFEEKIDCNGKKIKCLKIESDYKEKKDIKEDYQKKLTEYTKDEYYNIIKDSGIVENIFPIYTKYNSSLKTLIVNCVEYRRYISNNYFIIKNYIQQILETIDAIMEINKIKECYIVISKNDKVLKKIFNSFLGTYLKIKLFEINKIPFKKTEFKIIKKIKKQKYKDNPSEIGVLYHQLQTIYSIYEIHKCNKNSFSKIVTVITTNNSIEVGNFKIGLPITNLIDEKFREHEIYLLNDSTSRKINYNDDYVITKDLDAIVIL